MSSTSAPVQRWCPGSHVELRLASQPWSRILFEVNSSALSTCEVAELVVGVDSVAFTRWILWQFGGAEVPALVRPKGRVLPEGRPFRLHGCFVLFNCRIWLFRCVTLFGNTWLWGCVTLFGNTWLWESDSFFGRTYLTLLIGSVLLRALPRAVSLPV